MNMLIDEMQRLSANPWAWGVVAVFAMFAVHSLVMLLKCPFASGTASITDDQVAAAKGMSVGPGARFAVTMLGGAGLTLAGLFMIAYGISPTVALGALVAGVVLIQTEPARLQIREQKALVIANRDAPAPVLFGHRDRLRASHRNLALTNIALFAAVVLAMLVF